MEAKGEGYMGTYKLTAKAATIPAGLLVGIVAAMAVTALGACGAAWAILGGIISEGASGYCAMVILLLASAVGATVASGMIQRLRGQMCMAASGGYYLCLLVINALFFGGQYKGVGATAAMILCGCALVIMLTPGGKNRAGRRRRKNRTGKLCSLHKW